MEMLFSRHKLNYPEILELGKILNDVSYTCGVSFSDLELPGRQKNVCVQPSAEYYLTVKSRALLLLHAQKNPLDCTMCFLRQLSKRRHQNFNLITIITARPHALTHVCRTGNKQSINGGLCFSFLQDIILCDLNSPSPFILFQLLDQDCDGITRGTETCDVEVRVSVLTLSLSFSTFFQTNPVGVSQASHSLSLMYLSALLYNHQNHTYTLKGFHSHLLSSQDWQLHC